MARKKKKQVGPRRKRISREGRLSSAKATRWVTHYNGRNIVKGYARWYGVDLLCALIELRMLGVNIKPGREAQIRSTIEGRAASRKRRKEAALVGANDPDSEETFAYIAGHTPGGAPFGVMWEGTGKDPPAPESDDDIPF